jgi:hypothetical protein
VAEALLSVNARECFESLAGSIGKAADMIAD